MNKLETEWSRHVHDKPQSRDPKAVPSRVGAPADDRSWCVGAAGGRS